MQNRRHYSRRLRGWLLAAQDHRCAICRGPLSFHDAHVDHIIPLIAGGEEAITNLQLTHPSCNLRKGGMTAGLSLQERMPWAG